MPEVESLNMAHINTRMLEASKTRQQISTGSDVLKFVIN